MQTKIICTATLLLLFSSPLLSDVLATKEGMVINGKVIKKTQNIIVFSNSYGTFKVKRNIIKTLKETQSYRDDVKVFKSLGKKVNIREIRKNFQRGEKEKEKEKVNKKKGVKKDNKKFSDEIFKLNIHGAFFYNFNLGNLQNTMQNSSGSLLLFDFIFMKHAVKNRLFLIPEFRFESAYYNSQHSSNSIEGFSTTTGLLWTQYWKITSAFTLNLHLASLYGFGYYIVENSTTQRNKFSFITSLTLGLSFKIKRFIITPALRYEYIHDTAAPLHGLGLVLSLGVNI